MPHINLRSLKFAFGLLIKLKSLSFIMIFLSILYIPLERCFLANHKPNLKLTSKNLKSHGARTCMTLLTEHFIKALDDIFDLM